MVMAMKGEEEPFSADPQKRQVQLRSLIFCQYSVFLSIKKKHFQYIFFFHVIHLVYFCEIVCQNYGQIVLAGSILTTINVGLTQRRKHAAKHSRWHNGFDCVQ